MLGASLGDVLAGRVVELRGTIINRFGVPSLFGLMYPPFLSYPLPASGSMYPRDLYPLLDWQERW